MMRKWIGYALAGIAVLALTAVPALAASQPFNSNLDGTKLEPWNSELPNNLEGPIYSNYFRDGGETMNPGDCNTPLFPDDETWCMGKFFGPPKGGPSWRGPNSDIFNYDGVDGQMYHAFWNAELDGGEPEHRGYYAWVCKTVTFGEDSDWQPPDCIGDAQPATCLGNPDPTEVGPAADFWGGPEQSIEPEDSLTPMPIPYQVDDGNPNDELVTLEWNAVQARGECNSEAEYSLYYYVDDLSDGACDQPTADQFTFLKTVSTNTATVNVVDELGINLDDAKGVVWALKFFFPMALEDNRTNWDRESLYFSGNSLCTTFDTGLGATFLSVNAEYVGGRNVSVTWEAKEEGNLRGYYVTRAFNPNGPFNRVSELIASQGGGQYQYTDTIDVQRIRPGQMSGVFYKIEAVDSSNKVSATSSAASVEPPEAPTRIRTPQDRQIRRNIR